MRLESTNDLEDGVMRLFLNYQKNRKLWSLPSNGN